MLVWIVAGLGMGDEGKGATVDYLCRRTTNPKLIIRYNGGSQAAHNVVTPEGVQHTFSQFGSGSFRPEVYTHLSRYVFINPANMLNEGYALQKKGIANIFAKTSVACDAPIITPYNKAVNRLLEWSRGGNRHGSCGEGVGEARAYKEEELRLYLRADNLFSRVTTLEKLEQSKIWSWKRVEHLHDKAKQEPEGSQTRNAINLFDKDPDYSVFEEWSKLIGKISDDCLTRVTTCAVIFEGAQGFWLDEKHGYLPHTTWSNTTFDNAIMLCKEAGWTNIEKVGVLRTYATRHGAGPLPSEDPILQSRLSEAHNETGVYQGSFRYGYFDLEASRKAVEVTKPDYLIMNHCDQLKSFGQEALKIRLGNNLTTSVENTRVLWEWMKCLGAPIKVAGWGQTANDRRKVTSPWGEDDQGNSY